MWNYFLTWHELPGSESYSLLSRQRLARRLLTIRATLADEFKRDLRLVAADNAEIQTHHSEVVKNFVDATQVNIYIYIFVIAWSRTSSTRRRRI